MSLRLGLFSFLLAATGLGIPAGAAGDPPIVDQVARWKAAEIRSRDILALDKAVALFGKTRTPYELVEGKRVAGCPAPVIFSLHGRESSWNFRCHLHEGSPLNHRTRYVPKGRPPGDPPFTWEASAIDALYVLKREDLIPWRDPGRALQAIEAYNGLGYQRFHSDVPSPYLWSGTSLYARGKYTGDGHFDRIAIDKQLGVAAILKRMRERGIPIPFE